jgi:hypothetical protein
MVDLLGGSFLGDSLLGGDQAEVAGGPQGRSHGVATVVGDLTVTNPGGLSGTINGQASASGSLARTRRLVAAAHGSATGTGSITLPPSGLFVVIHGVGRAGGSLTERRLLIPVLVGIRVTGLALSASGGVAKANSEPQPPDTALDPSGGLLAKRALHTYFT